MERLTATKAKALKKPGRYRTGPTLYLNISQSGAKSWVQRLTISGVRRDIGLGSFSLVSLEKARRRAHENRVAVEDGRDIIAERRKAKMPAFKEAAARTYETLKPRWRSDKVAKNWWQILERHAFKRLGDIPVDRLGREDVLAVLTPLWTSKPEMGRKLRRGIKAILAWAQSHGYVEHNIAGEAIDGALPTMPSVKQNFRALPYQEVGEALEIVRESRASMSAKACFEFVVLTACRSGEARNATWGEINLEARTWIIPASRTKNGKEHRVPLSDEAVAVLEKARTLHDGDLIFPSPQRAGKPLSNMTLTKLLRDLGLADKATVHGFRSSFRDWCAETGKPRELAEAALAHVVGGVEGAYFRSDLFERRARLMESWGRFLSRAERGKVVALPVG